jgi:hypothetical protein
MLGSFGKHAEQGSSNPMGVSCASSASCVAVGHYLNARVREPEWTMGLDYSRHVAFPKLLRLPFSEQEHWASPRSA